MLKSRALNRVLSLTMLLILVGSTVFLVVTFGYLEILPALLLAIVAFFGCSLLINQLQIFSELDALKSGQSGQADFEQDINRRLLALEGAQSALKSSRQSETNGHLEQVLRAQTVVLSRLEAVEKQLELGIERISPDETSILPDHDETVSKTTLLKPASLSRIKLQDAINGDNLNLHLQPIVALPTRKPIHYEALMRLKLKNGDYLDAIQFLKIAEKGALMPNIDKKVMFSAVRMLRTLEVLKKKAGLFCNISGETLNDTRTYREIFNILQANVALKHSLVLEISQRHYRHLKTREKERLSKIADLGFVLSLDQVLDLRLDIPVLKKNGFRYVKISAGILLHASLDDNAPAAPSEMAIKLSDSGITLISTEVEKESDVMNLIDFGVQCAQGLVFAPPRPVKSELLQAGPNIQSGAARNKLSQKTSAA